MLLLRMLLLNYLPLCKKPNNKPMAHMQKLPKTLDTRHTM
eukprot:UN05792